MRPLLIAAGTVGFLAVALGAFGAHGLEGRLSAAAQDWWRTATLYALAHSLAALAVALSAARPGRLLRLAGWAFIAGIVLFSGALYALALGAPPLFGAVAPVGGLCFLAGWALIVVFGARR